MKPWRLELASDWILDGTWLQLGHGDEAVETLPIVGQIRVWLVLLQLGHGDEAVETARLAP